MSGKPIFVPLTKEEKMRLGVSNSNTIGGVWYPPMNAILTKTIPVRKPPSMAMMAVVNAKLPESYDPRGEGYLDPPFNQANCGSCWAVAASTCMNDVYKKLTKVNAKISPTTFLSCLTRNNDQCCGGLSEEAVYMAQKGVCGGCANYNWCNNLEGCSGSGEGHFTAECEELNRYIPECSNRNPKFKTTDLQTIEDTTLVKQAIMTYGSVIAGYVVYQDFMLSCAGGSEPGWSITNNIYINGSHNDAAIQEAYDGYVECPPPGVSGSQPSQCFSGRHTLS